MADGVGAERDDVAEGRRWDLSIAISDAGRVRKYVHGPLTFGYERLMTVAEHERLLSENGAMEITDQQVSAFLSVWVDEADVPYMARVRDYLPEGVMFGDDPEADARFRAAMEDAERRNAELVRRALRAALSTGGDGHAG